MQERQFKCDQCDKAFKRNSELVRHLTSHSDDRPYVCKTCGTSYKRSNHLRRHIESQHGTTLTNRRVQRLKKDEDGKLIPIQEEKKTKPTRKKKQKNEEKIISIVDTTGELVTFSIPESNDTLTAVLSINNESYNQNVIETVRLPYSNIILNNTDNVLLTNNSCKNLNDTNQIFIQDQFLSNANLNNMLQNVIPVNNTETCDILLPGNENLQNIQDTSENYLQNPYQFL